MNIQAPTTSPIIQSYSPELASPIGEEPVDSKASTVKPIEQSAEGAKLNQDPRASQDQQPLEQEAQRKLDQHKAEQEQVKQEAIDQLAARDREVRNHERAHATVGGAYAGAPRYEFERGPDGVSYAVAGEVSISTSPVAGDPQQTIEKAQVVKRAALAPAEPSSQDRAVAAEAITLETQARVELQAQNTQEQQEQRLQAERQQEEREAESDTVNALANNEVNSVNGSEDVDTKQSSDAIDEINKTQEDVFNEINRDLASQLVSLGGSAKAPQSLGSIINNLA